MKNTDQEHECRVIELPRRKAAHTPQSVQNPTDILESINTAIANVHSVRPADDGLLILAHANSYQQLTTLLQQFQSEPGSNTNPGKGHLCIVVRNLDERSERMFEIWRPA